jgi:hypothetical protein
MASPAASRKPPSCPYACYRAAVDGRPVRDLTLAGGSTSVVHWFAAENVKPCCDRPSFFRYHWLLLYPDYTGNAEVATLARRFAKVGTPCHG